VIDSWNKAAFETLDYYYYYYHYYYKSSDLSDTVTAVAA